MIMMTPNTTLKEHNEYLPFALNKILFTRADMNTTQYLHVVWNNPIRPSAMFYHDFMIMSVDQSGGSMVYVQMAVPEPLGCRLMPMLILRQATNRPYLLQSTCFAL